MSTTKIIFTVIGLIGLILLCIGAFKCKRKSESELSRDIISVKSAIIGIIGMLVGIAGYIIS